MRSYFILFVLICFVSLSASDLLSQTEEVDVTLEDTFIYTSRRHVIRYNAENDNTDTLFRLKNELKPNGLILYENETIEYTYSGNFYREVYDEETGEQLICPCTPYDSSLLYGTSSSMYHTIYEKMEEDVWTYTILKDQNYLSARKYYMRSDSMKSRDYRITQMTLAKNKDTLSITERHVFCEAMTRRRSFNCGDAQHRETWYSESEWVNDKQYFTEKGHLYSRTTSNMRPKLELSFTKAEFFYKYGNGYYAPTLSPNGKKLIIRKSRRTFYEDMLVGKGNLLQLDIETGDTVSISNEYYERPTYSPSGKFVLLYRPIGGWVNKSTRNEIFLYDVETTEVKRIGYGNNYTWNQRKPLTN